MYLEKVQACPLCYSKAQIVKEEEAEGLLRYYFRCPKCNLRYASSWKKPPAKRRAKAN
mgnify:FL=1